MLAPVRQAADDGIRTAVGCELADIPMPPHHGVVGREVEILAGECDAGATADAERADDVGLSVSRRVAQQAHAAARSRHRDEDVAVFQDDHVSRRADRFRDDQRAEARLQCQPDIVGRANDFFGLLR